jgi:hypothetical protein
MASRELDPAQVGAVVVAREKERYRRMVAAVQRTVALHGPRLAQEEVDRTDPKPVDRGTYRRSFEVHDLPDGAVFLNSSPYGEIVERGRRPGRWPPIDKIEQWVRRKFRVQLGQFKSRRKTVVERRFVVLRRKVTLASQRDREVRSIAFLVARKIARRGIEGKRVLFRAERRLTPIVRDAVRLAAKMDGP